MKKYLLQGGIIGFVITAIVLTVVEFSTKSSGFSSPGSILPEKAFLIDAIQAYALFLIVGVIVGIILGWVVVKIRGNK